MKNILVLYHQRGNLHINLLRAREIDYIKARIDDVGPVSKSIFFIFDLEKVEIENSLFEYITVITSIYELSVLNI